MDDVAIHRLQRLQSGVISRRQVLEAGGTDNDVQRLIRRREWARVHEGVYVEHTGPLSWDQRAWAAVLFHWPAALDGDAALRAHGMRSQQSRASDTMSLVVPPRRRVDPQPGIATSRSATYDVDVLANLSPPRIRVEAAVLQVASRARSEDGAVAVISDACQTGRTTPGRLLVALDDRPRIRHRRLMAEILRDVAAGTYSALERRFLLRVERAHGLPTGSRQRRVTIGAKPFFRDVEYVGLHTVVELDGRVGHTTALDRWADLERDLLGARHGDLTVRIGWLQTLEPHRLADGLGALLVARGWAGRARPCGPDCSIGKESGGSPALGAGDPPLRPSA